MKSRRADAAKRHPIRSIADLTPLNSSVGTMLHNLTGQWRFSRPVFSEKIQPCRFACPAGNDIQNWLFSLARGREYDAFRSLKMEVPFPAITGRVCFSFCENECSRGMFDGHLSIRGIERYLADSFSGRQVVEPGKTGVSLAVVGSGPAGMAAAYYGRLLGFETRVFEARQSPGGILAAGIPAYRLPRNVLKSAIDELVAMGVVFSCQKVLGRDFGIKELLSDFDYLFLATGAHKPMQLNIPGEDGGIIDGLELLKRIAAGEPAGIGRRVVVIGGGNTAIDAARSLVRLGHEVTVAYRRGKEQMPAHPEEVDAAREEGVVFEFLAGPEMVETDGTGRVVSLVCRRMELVGVENKERPFPVPCSEKSFKIPCDGVVKAIGEAVENRCLGKEVPADESGVVTDDYLAVVMKGGPGGRVFAGGDMAKNPRSVVHALASGKKAAMIMDMLRKEMDVGAVIDRIRIGGALSFSAYIDGSEKGITEVVQPAHITYSYFTRAEPERERIDPPQKRKRSFDPYVCTLTGEQARREAMRCFHCGRCVECDNCLIFCPDMSVIRGGSTGGYIFDYDYCKGCGICAVECPRGVITMIPEEAD